MIITMITTMTITMIVIMVVMTPFWQMEEVHAPPWLSKLYEAPASQPDQTDSNTLFNIVLICSALFCFGHPDTLHCTILTAMSCTALFSTELYCTILNCTCLHSDRRAVTHCIIYLLLQNTGTILYYPVCILYHVEQFNCSMGTHSLTVFYCAVQEVHYIAFYEFMLNCIVFHCTELLFKL